MKNVLFICTLFLLFSCSKPGIEGTWKPVSVDGKDMSESRKSLLFKFLNKGVFTMSNGIDNGSGTWSYDESKKEMVIICNITSNSGENKTEVFNWSDVLINGNELTVKDPAGVIKFERQE